MDVSHHLYALKIRVPGTLWIEVKWWPCSQSGHGDKEKIVCPGCWTQSQSLYCQSYPVSSCTLLWTW